MENNDYENDDYDVLAAYFMTKMLLPKVQVELIKTVIIHPMRYAKMLIQLGYEPLPPTEAKMYYLGRRVLILPNRFAYIKHIYNSDGLLGCFRGLPARLWFSFSFFTTYRSILIRNKEKIESAINNSNYNELIWWDITAKIAATLLSHPFFVVSNRQMAQFIGKEIKYNKNVFKLLYEIAEDEGILALFSGCMPRIMKNISTLLVFYGTVFAINKFILRNRPYQQFLSFGMAFIASSLLYPFNLISVCMSVNGSGLKAGSPPFMPDYNNNWLRCYDHLLTNNQLRRGRNMFWREAAPPKRSYMSPSLIQL